MSQLAQHGAFGLGQARKGAGMQTATQSLLGGSCPLFGHKCRLAVIPHFQKFITGSRPNQARMKINPANQMHRECDGYCSKYLQYPKSPLRNADNGPSKSLHIFMGKGSGKAPFVTVQGAQIQTFNLEQINGFGALHFDGARQIVDLGQVDILDVV
jgi:hypothetical protein